MLLVAILAASAVNAQQALSAQKMTIDAWQSCTERYANQFAERSRESADVIADASLAACAEEENRTMRLYIDAGLSSEAANETIDRHRASRRRLLILLTVVKRSAPKQ